MKFFSPWKPVITKQMYRLKVVIGTSKKLYELVLDLFYQYWLHRGCAHSNFLIANVLCIRELTEHTDGR